MDMSKYQPQSEFCKTWHQKGLDEGRQEGRESLQKCLLSMLSQRGIPLTESDRGRIRACQDQALLDRWFTRVLSATCAEDLFRDS